MPYITSNGLKIYYETHGSGFPLVMVHGYNETHEMWQPQVDALSARYRLITFDMIGHGLTEAPEDPSRYSTDRVVEDLNQLITTLDMKKVAVLGHSLGGYVVMRYYLAHPDKVAALIVFAAGPGFRNLEQRAAWNRLQDRYIEALARGGVEELAAKFSYLSPRGADLSSTNAAALSRVAGGVMKQHDSLVIDSLSRIAVPALIVHGDRDKRIFNAAQYELKKIPGSRLAVIPKAGHAANRNNPEAFNRAVLEFLDGLAL